jgi:hypothetical protein
VLVIVAADATLPDKASTRLADAANFDSFPILPPLTRQRRIDYYVS